METLAPPDVTLAQVSEHSSPQLGWWRMVYAPPHPRLAPFVRSFCDYEERTSFSRRREVAQADVTLIIARGPALRMIDRQPNVLRSFVVGPDDSYAVIESDGLQSGVEVGLTPFGARRLLGLPMHLIGGEVVDLEQALGRAGRELVEGLGNAPDWQARFAILDNFLAARIEPEPASPPSIEWAWRRLVASHGTVRVEALASELGCSRRHLSAGFREHVGLAPKTVARVLRFRRAIDLLERSDGDSLGAIAHGCGYSDQSHFVRDFREFAGVPPSDYLGRRLPDGGGVRGD